MISFILKYFVEILFTFFVTIITYLYKKIFNYIKKISALEKINCLILKKYILEQYEIIKRNGYITIEEKEDIMEMYDIYNNISCSNIVDEIVKEINNMPLK